MEQKKVTSYFLKDYAVYDLVSLLCLVYITFGDNFMYKNTNFYAEFLFIIFKGKPFFKLVTKLEF